MSLSINLNGSSSSDASSGIDVTSVVNQILDSERAPERLWQTQQSTLTAQSAALKTINSEMSTLQAKVNALRDVLGVLSQKTATSSRTDILTASAQTSAAAGDHIVVVGNLATTSSYYTDALASSSTTFGTGTLNLQVGSNSAVPIPIDNTNNTLDTLASYINSNNLGVTASVINDASGARLALLSQSTGLPGDLTIAGSVSGLTFHKIAGTNASLTVDSVPISSASNTLSGVIPGVTLNLVSSSPGTEVHVSVGADVAGVKQAINDFVSSYNVVIAAINSQFTVDTANNTAGPLASDSSLRVLQSTLLSDMTYSIDGNNGITSLASFGVNMANDGTLSVDDSQLSSVLANNLSDVQNFFQSVDSSAFGSHLNTDLTSMTAPSTGLISVDLNGIDSTQKVLAKQISDLEDRLAVQQQALIRQYSQIDTALREYSLLMSQVTSQLATLPKP